MKEFFPCPHCGAEVPAKAPACTECGSDAQTGWSAGPDESTLPADEDWEYENALQEEFGSQRPNRALPGWLAVAGFALLLLLLYALVLR